MQTHKICIYLLFEKYSKKKTAVEHGYIVTDVLIK